MFPLPHWFLCGTYFLPWQKNIKPALQRHDVIGRNVGPFNITTLNNLELVIHVLSDRYWASLYFLWNFIIPYSPSVSSVQLSGVPWYTVWEVQVYLTRKPEVVDLGVSLGAWWYHQRSSLLVSCTSWSQDSCHGANITFLHPRAAIKMRKERRTVQWDKIDLLLYSIWTWWWMADRCLSCRDFLN